MFLLSIALLTIASAFAQTATLSYQAVVRDSHNKFVRNTDIDVEVRISVESTERYYETRTAHTNQNGVVSFSIGDASRTSHTGDELVDITGWRNATISVTFHLADGDVTTNSPVSAVPYALEVNPALLPTVNDATLTIQKNSTDVGTFTANQGMFGKVYFPRLVVPLATVISNLVRFGVQLGLFVAIYLYFFFNGSNIHLTWAVILVPIFIVMLAGLGLGFGILVSSMTTKYRDLNILFSFIVQLWMYATPIVYPISMVPEGKLRMLIMLNPMTSIIEAFKYATLGHGYYSWPTLCYSFAFICILLVLGIVIFNRVQRSFMDTV